MAMTRKHYRQAAEIIRGRVEDTRAHTPADLQTPCLEMLGVIANDFAIMFKADNSAFRRGQFLEACGLAEVNA